MTHLREQRMFARLPGRGPPGVVAASFGLTIGLTLLALGPLSLLLFTPEASRDGTT